MKISLNRLQNGVGIAEIMRKGESMKVDKVYAMGFGKVYPLLVNKAVCKGRTKQEVDKVIIWLTGYSQQELDKLALTPITYEEFFKNAPVMNPKRRQIMGTVCGVRVENIEEPLMQEIRYLDKLIDELAKGKPMEKILRDN